MTIDELRDLLPPMSVDSRRAEAVEAEAYWRDYAEALDTLVLDRWPKETVRHYNRRWDEKELWAAEAKRTADWWHRIARGERPKIEEAKP